MGCDLILENLVCYGRVAALGQLGEGCCIVEAGSEAACTLFGRSSLLHSMKHLDMMKMQQTYWSCSESAREDSVCQTCSQIESLHRVGRCYSDFDSVKPDCSLRTYPRSSLKGTSSNCHTVHSHHFDRKTRLDCNSDCSDCSKRLRRGLRYHSPAEWQPSHTAESRTCSRRTGSSTNPTRWNMQQPAWRTMDSYIRSAGATGRPLGRRSSRIGCTATSSSLQSTRGVHDPVIVEAATTRLRHSRVGFNDSVMPLQALDRSATRVA